MGGNNLEDREKGRRKSNEYQERKRQLYHAFESFPIIKHDQ
jgi:hypothetical protein